MTEKKARAKKTPEPKKVVIRLGKVGKINSKDIRRAVRAVREAREKALKNL